MPIVKLQLSQIEIDPSLQCREKQDVDTIAEYSAAYKAGAKIPPMVVFNDGKKRWLADGFHRHPAAKSAGLKTIAVEERKGTKRDALLFAVSANAEHGLRRTNADKRRAVETLLSDAEWSKWPGAEIARRCAVTHTFVNNVKREIAPKMPETVSGEIQRAPAKTAKKAPLPKIADSSVKSENSESDNDIEGLLDDEPAGGQTDDPMRSAEVETLHAAHDAHNPTREIANRIKEIIRDWEAIGQDAHPFISAQSIVAHLKSAADEIRLGQPHASCPYCKGAKCRAREGWVTACKGTGWVPKAVYDSAPDKENTVTL